VGVDKPVFAQRKKDEKMSLLGTFNAQEDAKECVRQMYKEREKYVTPVTTRQVDFPPRRPIYEGAAPPKLELASKKPTVQEEKSRWEKGNWGATGNVVAYEEESTSSLLYGPPHRCKHLQLRWNQHTMERVEQRLSS
jgi:hypothetical protein